MTKYRRSSLGGHWVGTGIQSPTSQEFDDFVKKRGNRNYKSTMFETDKFKSDKEGKKAFEKYCEEQSGEVITYNMNDKSPE